MSPRQARLAAFAALNIVLIAVGWFMLVSPQRNHASAAAAQEELVQSQLAALTAGGPSTPVKQPAINTSDLYKLDTALPSQADQTELLFELERLAATSGVDILNVAPQAAQMTGSYTVKPINLSIDGSYGHIVQFLHNLRTLVSERDGRLIANGPLFAVTSVGLNPGEVEEKNQTGEVATVGLAAFYYGAVDGATPPASTATTDTTTTPTGG